MAGALVDYDYGSASDDDEIDETNEENNSGSVIVNVSQETKEELPANSDRRPLLFSELPQTNKGGAGDAEKDTTAVMDDKIEDFVPKYKPAKQNKVKITLPALSEYKIDDEDDDDDEDNNAEKRRRWSLKKNTAGGSGLLAVLPPVRGTLITNTSFVPNVLKKTPLTSSSNNKRPASTAHLIPNKLRKQAELAKKAVIEKALKGSGDEDEDDVEMPETFDDAVWEKVCGRASTKPTILLNAEIETPPDVAPVDIAPEPPAAYEGLDNVAFKKLVGKTRLYPQNIRLIDLNEEDVLPEKDMWMRKSLTDPEQLAPVLVDNPVDPTRKKKHHITYLAEKALASEQEFKNQWANNKHARNQTRAKYGF